MPRLRITLATVFLSLCTSGAFSQSVVLWRNQSTARGVWREETRLAVSGMTLKIGSGEQTTGGTGSFAFLESVERDFSNANRQEAQVLSSSTQGNLAILGKTQEVMQGGALLGKRLLGKREQNHWQFVFKDVKPSPEEQKALDDFGKRSDLLAFLPYLYGGQARRKGERWKADTGELTKGAKGGASSTIELSFTLVDVVDHQGMRCANLGVSGFINSALGAGNASTFKLEVRGDIWRDVRDLVDVDESARDAHSRRNAGEEC